MKSSLNYKFLFIWGPPLWARRQHARLTRSGPGFDPRSGQVSWVRFFRGFSSPVRQMSVSFRPPRSPNIIWRSLSSWLIIHYGRQWPEMLTRPKTLNRLYRHTHISLSETEDCFINPLLIETEMKECIYRVPCIGFIFSCRSFKSPKFFFCNLPYCKKLKDILLIFSTAQSNNFLGVLWWDLEVTENLIS